jgi:hypothetical protein
MAFDAGRVRSRRQARLLRLKAAVRIVTIRALHGAFKYFVMEGLVELVLNLDVAAQAKLGFTQLQHSDG